MTQYKPGNILLNKYRIEKLIGEGAFAEVYLATHIELNVPRALKILRKEAPGVGSTEFEDFQERFKLEVQLGARINHPNVVQVHDFEREGDTLILVMEYCPGGSLTERIRLGNETNNLIPIDEVVKIGIETASGLGAIHALDAVHRDLKPSNILFDKNQRAKVADLGLAQIPGGPSMRSKLSQPAPHPGTPGYMSPEQDKSSAYLSPASDVYSLGMVMFGLLTGRFYHGQRPGTRPSQLRAEVPAWLDDLITQMLSLDPEARPWDGSEVACLLRQGLKTGTLQYRSDLIPVAAAALPPRPSPASQQSEQADASDGLPFDLSVSLKNRPLLVAVGGLLLLLFLFIVVGNWFIRRYSSDPASLDATRTTFKQAVRLTETRLARETSTWTNTPSVAKTNTPTITNSPSRTYTTQPDEPTDTVRPTNTPVRPTNTATRTRRPTNTPSGNGGEPSPMQFQIGSPVESCAARETGYDTLVKSANESFDSSDRLRGDTARDYTITLNSSKDMLWGHGWCAINQSTLEDNWNSINWSFKLYGRDFGLERFCRTNIYRDSSNYYCQGYWAWVRKFGEGYFDFTTIMEFTSPVNDGISTSNYPAATHIENFRVTVSR